MSPLRLAFRPSLSWSVACALAANLVACGGSHEDASPASAPATVVTATDNLRTIITGDWTLPPGEESYVCARTTVEEDIFVSGFEAINPPGTHHTLLTMGAPDKPDGVIPCNAAENRTLSVFGSGVGTDPLNMPEGVVVKIEKGTQLLLNLHLFNTTEDVMTGTSGTKVRSIPEADVEHVAEGLLAGTIDLNIPAGQTTEHTGYCTMSEDVTVFAVAPHMHQLGIHEKVFAESAAEGEISLMDQAYSFDEQTYRLIDPVKLAKGDRLRIECTHKNTTAKDVTFGESSLSEMCFAGVYRYPADGSFFICDDDFGKLAPPAAQ